MVTKAGMTRKAQFAISASKATSSLLRMLKLGEGATLPGRVMLRIHPHAIEELSAALPTILISGTNAKTTTTALTKSGLSTKYDVISNVTGANMREGIAFSLGSRNLAASHSSIGLFEVDEAYLPSIGKMMNVSIVALLNLSRDQLDRVSETRMTAGKWRSFLVANQNVKVVANCDDPLVTYSAEVSPEVTWVAAGLNFKFDARSCPHCGGEIDFTSERWICDGCGFVRPNPEILVNDTGIVLEGNKIEIPLSLPGQCNIANAAIGLGICRLMNVPLESAVEGMTSLSEVAGRYKRLDIAGHNVRMLLSKNPAGWYEIFDLVGDDKSVVVAINSRIADGRDPSWLWDVPFEQLKGKEVFAAGERAYDLSVRLLYADIPNSVVKDPVDAIRMCSADTVSFVGNYTSFQDLRRSLEGPDRPYKTSIKKVGELLFR